MKFEKVWISLLIGVVFSLFPKVLNTLYIPETMNAFVQDTFFDKKRVALKVIFEKVMIFY